MGLVHSINRGGTTNTQILRSKKSQKMNRTKGVKESATRCIHLLPKMCGIELTISNFLVPNLKRFAPDAVENGQESTLESVLKHLGANSKD